MPTSPSTHFLSSQERHHRQLGRHISIRANSRHDLRTFQPRQGIHGENVLLNFGQPSEFASQTHSSLRDRLALMTRHPLEHDAFPSESFPSGPQGDAVVSGSNKL